MQALNETTRLAQEADRLGYHRYWVSEHHSSRSLAHSSPEVLIAHLASHTSRIRVGSGGIMLPHYSAYKVAENFRLLEALYPGRIDLGIGRAPGGRPLSTRALQEGHFHHGDNYPEQVIDLIAYLHDAVPGDHRFSGILASPSIPTAPELWLLGSSGGTAGLAAEVGASYAFAQFFNVAGSSDSVRMYRERFIPSLMEPNPRALAAVLVICAETEQEALDLSSSVALYFYGLEIGMEFTALPSVETALSYPYTSYDLMRIEAAREKRAIGTPEQVKAKLEKLAEEYQSDELLLVSPIHDIKARLRSYQLVAEAFGLQRH
jgi:luciferase family oxidoreductase group 1